MNTAPKKITHVASVAYVRTQMLVDENVLNAIKQITYRSLPRTDLQISVPKEIFDE